MAVLLTPRLTEARRIARFMDLDRWEQVDDLALADHVGQGLPAASVAAVVRRIDPQGRFLKESDIVPKSTLHRRKGEMLSKDDSETLWSIARVAAETLRIYHDDADRAAMFLSAPHPLLKGRRPIDVARASVTGADLVVRLLASADAGVAV
jgi:putative toxin-antitoxin system antitoxin component (TIGR02293 family)